MFCYQNPLEFMQSIDKTLSRLLPNLLAMQTKIVLTKSKKT
jgi:hypothetical protein